MQQFRLPVSRQHSHPPDIYRYRDSPYPSGKVSISRQDTTLVGRLCASKDVFVREIQIEVVDTGGVTVFRYVDAYE